MCYVVVVVGGLVAFVANIVVVVVVAVVLGYVAAVVRIGICYVAVVVVLPFLSLYYAIRSPTPHFHDIVTVTSQRLMLCDLTVISERSFAVSH